MFELRVGLRRWAYVLSVCVFLSTYARASETYVAVLNTEQTVIRPSDSAAYGYAVLTLSEDSEVLCYAISTTNLAGKEFGSQFLIGRPWEESSQLIFENDSENEFSGDLKTGCVGPFSNAEIAALKSGEFHINIATDYYPEGEIGGQIVYLSPSKDLTIERLLSLGPERWQVLEEMLALEEEDWATLNGFIQRDGAAVISPYGVFSRQDSIADGILVDAATLYDIASVTNGIGDTQAEEDDEGITLFAHDGAIKNRLTTITDRLPDDPDVRNFFKEIDLQDIRELLKKVKEEVKEIIQFVKDLRDSAGFGSWKGSNCDAASECGQFKADLEGVLDDLQTVWEGVQRLSCLDDPEIKIRRLPGFGVSGGQPELFRNLLINKAPRIVLYVLSKMFKRFDGWQDFVGDIADGIPLELTTFCNDSQPSTAFHLTSSASIGDSCRPAAFPGSRKCCVLRKSGTNAGLKYLRAKIKLALLLFEIGESWTTPSKVICMNIDAVAGGGAGTNTPNPTHSVDKTIKLILSKLDKIVETILKERDKCLDADKRIEEDLLQCNAFAEYLIEEDDGGRKGEVNDLVTRRLDLLQGTGFISASQRAKVENEMQNDFGDLCTEYRKLLNGNNR